MERHWPYRWGFDDCDSLDNLFLVHLCSRTVQVAHNGRHTGFVSHGCSEMDWLLGVIFRK